MSTPDALSFSTLVATLEDGQLHADLTKLVKEIVADMNNAVLEHGGSQSAALALALSFKLEGGVIEVKAETKVKMPKENRQRTILYSTADNQLTRKNPKQTELSFRDVTKTPEMRDAQA